MSPPPAFDPVLTLYEAINEVNPQLPVPLDATTVTLGVPAPMTNPIAGGVNTMLVAKAVAGNGFDGQFTTYYRRSDLTGLFTAAGIDATLDAVTIHSWSDLIAALNARYNTALTIDDVPQSPWIDPPLPSTFVYAVPTTSLMYTGSLSIQLTGAPAPPPSPDLSTGITTAVLAGLNYPVVNPN
jgi:hypothetical protein